MNAQPEALRLAELLDCSVVVSDQQAAAELRRLHAELERCKQVCAATAEAWREDVQRKPLTEEELSKIINKEIGFNSCVGWEEDFARAIERAHGIGGSNESA